MLSVSCETLLRICKQYGTPMTVAIRLLGQASARMCCPSQSFIDPQ